MICTQCDFSFNPDLLFHKKHGLYTECGNCGRVTDKKRKVNRTIGIQGGEGINKSANIAIIPNPKPIHRAMLVAQTTGGFGARLPFSFKVDSEDRKEVADMQREEQKPVFKQKGPEVYRLKQTTKRRYKDIEKS